LEKFQKSQTGEKSVEAVAVGLGHSSLEVGRKEVRPTVNWR
jgi:hypothetical protein